MQRWPDTLEDRDEKTECVRTLTRAKSAFGPAGKIKPQGKAGSRMAASCAHQEIIATQEFPHALWKRLMVSPA
jgi:hypothetical protein